MRATITSLLQLAAPSIPLERIMQAGSVHENPATPFILYRFAGTFPGVTKRSKTKTVSLEVWVHDEPGDYSQIEGILNQIEDTFDSVVHASAAEGESISSAQYESRSPDLNDDGFKTICKMTNYTIVGRG